MKETQLNKLTRLSVDMYASICKHMKQAYFQKWNPLFEEWKLLLEELCKSYEKVGKSGKVLQEQSQTLHVLTKQVAELPDLIFEQGKLEILDEVVQAISQGLEEMVQVLQSGVERYQQVEESMSHLDSYAKEFVAASSTLIQDYKIKLSNRLQQNIGKVRGFEQLSPEERRYFMTHVILFDEGKLENTILDYLSKAEHNVEMEALEVERSAIISSKPMDLEMSVAYVEAYRNRNDKVNPKTLSLSEKILQQGEIENKFEIWFESLMGENSTVGQLIQDGSHEIGMAMEIQMLTAMESVIDGNLKELDMTSMLDAYRAECSDIKVTSFEELYGGYEDVVGILSTIKDIQKLIPEWEEEKLSLADIVLGGQ